MLATLGIISFGQRLLAYFVIGIALGGGLAVWAKARDLRIAHAAVIQRDAVWEKKFAEASALAERERDALQKKVDDAAAREREASDALSTAADRAVQLERALDDLKTDPVVFPRSVARTLRQ